MDVSFPDTLTCDLTNYMYYKGGSEELVVSWMKFLDRQFPNCVFLKSIDILTNKEKKVEVYDTENTRVAFRKFLDESSTYAKICFHLGMCDDRKQCHSNAIVIDRTHKEVVFYEPHGESSARMVNKLYPEHRKKMKEFIKEIVAEEYDFKTVHRRDEEGIQTRTEYHVDRVYRDIPVVKNRYFDEAEGYCTMWSLLFIHYNLLNPSFSAVELYRNIIDRHDLDIWALKIRAYSASVYNNYIHGGSVDVPDSITEMNPEVLSDIIKKQEQSYYNVCSERLRKNFRQTLKIQQIENFVMEEPVHTMIGNLVREERLKYGRYHQRLCKSDSVKSGRLELIRYALEHFQNSLNAIVFLQLADRFNSVSSANNDNLLAMVSIVDNLYNIRTQKNFVSERILIETARVLEFSFFEPNTHFFYSLCVYLWTNLTHLFSDVMEYFYHAHLICMTNHIYACLPSSYQCVGLLCFLTGGNYTNVIYSSIPEAVKIPLETLLSKTKEEIEQCGRLVNNIILSTKGLAIHPLVDEYQHKLLSMVMEIDSEITVPTIRLIKDISRMHIPTEIKEPDIGKYNLVKRRSGFSLYKDATNERFYKFYSCDVDKQLCLMNLFREISFINTELLDAHYTDQSLTPFLEILPYEMSLRDFRQTLLYEKDYFIMNRKTMKIESAAMNIDMSLISFIRTKMQSCFEQLSNMHNMGFVHGNIKLDYIVIRNGKCFLSDFRYVRRLTTVIHNYGYTVPYSDDKIDNGKGEIDFFSDIFALAMTICGLFYLHFEEIWKFLDENLVAYRGFERYDNILKIAQHLAISIEKYDKKLSDLLSKMFASRKYRFTIEECLQHKFFSN